MCWREKRCGISNSWFENAVLLFRKKIDRLDENHRPIHMNREMQGYWPNGNRTNLQTQDVQFIKRFAQIARSVG